MDLSFLNADASHEAQIYVDGGDAHWESNPYSMTIETRQVAAADRLSLQLAPGGGAAVRLTRTGQ